MSPRRRRAPKPGIGVPFTFGASAALAFAVLFFLTASFPVAIIGGVIFGVAVVLYLPLRRRSKARAARQ